MGLTAAQNEVSRCWVQVKLGASPETDKTKESLDGLHSDFR